MHAGADRPAAIALIAAVARNGVVGAGGAMPWRIPEDARWFRQQTSGWPVIMGRKTWDSLPERFRPLPGRRNVVVTRNAAWQAQGAEAASSLAQALALVCDAPKAFVIGGSQLWAEAMPLADELVLTRIGRDYDGDTFFPPIPPGFTEVACERVHAAAPNDLDLEFVTLRRPA